MDAGLHVEAYETASTPTPLDILDPPAMARADSMG
jgi:hypothetical protein